jgi:ATP-dependent Clp protease ATP-binding subunit ClpA
MPRGPETIETNEGPLHPVGHDLTLLARQGRFAPLNTHQAEVERIIAVLATDRSVRKRYNPLLIGEPGAERFAIIAEVVRRLATGEAPAALAARPVLALDLETLFAGVTSYSLFEQRFREVCWQVNQATAILFVDNFHLLLGGRYLFDAATILKPVLARRQIQLLGTTTLQDYRRFIERDQSICCRLRRW